MSPEVLAWTTLTSHIREAKDCIVESTGVIYRLRELWTPELANRGIYTIKFTAPIEICQKRARERNREPIEGYDLDESYAILLEEELHQCVPANLVVDTSNIEENTDERFSQVERYILRARKCFEIYKSVEVIGNNKLT